jgi:hypothetical protein
MPTLIEANGYGTAYSTHMTPEQTEMFRVLEESLHRKEIRNSRARVSELIADDFVEFGKSGAVYHKEEILNALEDEQIDLEIEVSEFVARELSSDVVLVTYKSTAEGLTANRSSIWVKRDCRWQMTFHQGTTIK